MIEIVQNFDPRAFVWLWAKYVRGFNPKYHCTNSILGKYSCKFSKHNKDLTTSEVIVMDECPPDSYRAIYICGVAKDGYAKKKNYEHNVHAAICPRVGVCDNWSFEKWHVRVRHGSFLYIPVSEQELPFKYRGLPTEYVTCRIFRWSASYFGERESDDNC
jgi:hypothetical protein